MTHTQIQQMEELALKSEFDREGFVILRDIIPPEYVENAKPAIDTLVDREADRLVSEGKLAERFTGDPFESRLIRLFERYPDEAPKIYRPELHLAPLFHFFFNPAILDLVQVILGDEIRLYPNYSLRPKVPDNVRGQVLWHQDGGYTAKGKADSEVETLLMVNAWTPLVPVNRENGCMQFIPGTHKKGVVPHVRKEHYLEIRRDIIEQCLKTSDLVDLEIAPGDVALFHNLLFHHGLPNRSKTIRWSLDFRYQDARQSTFRAHNGHLARSRAHPEAVVRSPEHWARLSFV